MANGNGQGHTAPPQHKGSGFGDILQKETAGMPNWAWLAIIAAGIAAAYIVPKFLGSGGAQTSSQKTPDQTSTDTGTAASGLGLAIDPATGLPYAVEGLVPSGGAAGGQWPFPLPPSLSGGGTTTQATPDMTATNTLLQQILALLQNQGVRPHHGKGGGGKPKKKTPGPWPVDIPPPTTTGGGLRPVDIPPPVVGPPTPPPRPTVPQWPVDRIPNPVLLRPKAPAGTPLPGTPPSPTGVRPRGPTNPLATGTRRG